MRKIMIITEPLAGGVRKHVLQIVEGLDKEKFQIFLIYGSENVDQVFINNIKEIKNNCTLIRCESLKREINICNDFKSYIFINKIIKKIKPDVVHCHSSKAGVVGRLAAKSCGVKKIYYTPHAYAFFSMGFSKKKRMLFSFIETIMSRFFTTLTFNVSDEEKSLAIARKIDYPRKFVTIYNGLPDVNFPPVDFIKKDLDIPLNKIVIGNIARLDKQKNPYEFLRIAKQISLKNPNRYYFVWIGEGPFETEFNSKILSLNLENCCKRIDFRQETELLIASFDIILTTSLYEGLPYSLIEALRAGVPILASDVVGHQEIVKKNLNGSLYDLSANVDWIKTIDKLLSLNKDKIIIDFKQRFYLETMINKLIHYYES